MPNLKKYYNTCYLIIHTLTSLKSTPLLQIFNNQRLQLVSKIVGNQNCIKWQLMVTMKTCKWTTFRSELC